MRLAGWGRYPAVECRLIAPRDEAGLAAAVARAPLIARGNGRAYGDSALNAGQTVSMRHFNRMLGFDPESGQLTAEAGVLLADIVDVFGPRGWFPPVTPGTKFVTLGGMIAADVHGKNHHVHGAFGNFVDWIDVMGPDGTARRCSRDQNAALFEWTVGGMGLTGIILRTAFCLKPVETGWIRQSLVAAPDLDAAMAAFEAARQPTYSVAWIDCLGRGAALGRSIVMTGEHACPAELPARQALHPMGPPDGRGLRVPFDFPALALNRLSVRAFNALYYRRGARNAGTSYVGWDSFFYPLDGVRDWNRIYGRRGFMQFQCVLPPAAARAGLRALLEAISGAGQGSFLAVLKRLGPQQSRFSFPMEGYTLALDFPRSAAALALLERLDRITLDHGGRFYLAKDSRMSAETLRGSDNRAARFKALRAADGCAEHFVSHQSERLSL